MNEELTESQQFLSKFITGWQRDWAKRFLLKYRRENDTIEVPAAVDAYREFNKVLHELRDDVSEVKQDAHKAAKGIQRWFTILKFGGSQAEEEYPSQKRK